MLSQTLTVSLALFSVVLDVQPSASALTLLCVLRWEPQPHCDSIYYFRADDNKVCVLSSER